MKKKFPPVAAHYVLVAVYIDEDGKDMRLEAAEVYPGNVVGGEYPTVPFVMEETPLALLSPSSITRVLEAVANRVGLVVRWLQDHPKPRH